MLINDECLEISNDIIETITEVGTTIVLKTVVNTTEVTNEKDLYSKYYGQVKNNTPLIGKTYSLNAVLTYNPTEDNIKSAGLEEKCSILVMVATYEFIKVGLFTLEDDVHDIITELKRNKVIEVNGKTFVIKNVGMTGTLNGFPTVCNLGCEVYD